MEKNEINMLHLELKDRIEVAIKKRDKEKLIELQEELRRFIWLNSFNGSVPVMKWINNKF